MPGVASLEKNEYYALPRNAFWRIMGDLFDADPGLLYSERLKKMTGRGIALWDVLETCHRPGSLDSAIEASTARPNDFATLFRENLSIRHVFFNGRKAADLYMRCVFQKLSTDVKEKSYLTLPSTSPAHASMSYAEKLEKWSVVARAIADPPEKPSMTSGRPDAVQPLRDARDSRE
jgi:hypoxanthine-DNA glycosylase